MSVGTLDESVRRIVEPGTPPGRKRLEILGRFAAAGIRTFVLVAPVLPGLTDDDARLEEVLGEIAAQGIGGASVIPLHVRKGIRDHFVPWLRGAYPELADRYERLYGQRAYAPREYAEELQARFRRLRDAHGLAGLGLRTAPPAAEPRGQLALAL
jgi:DNA repair photolyase